MLGSCAHSGLMPSTHTHEMRIGLVGKDGAPSAGILTNMHISDQRIVGTIPPELCLFEALRELDLDGGDLTGAIPDWIPRCFPDLSELDLSFNELAGAFPSWVPDIASLQEVEFGYNWVRLVCFTCSRCQGSANCRGCGRCTCIQQVLASRRPRVQLTGTVPEDIGRLPKLRELELSGNTFSGLIPASLAATNSTLTSFKIADNGFEGDLLPLADVELVQVAVHRNPALCGMVRKRCLCVQLLWPRIHKQGTPCIDVVELSCTAARSADGRHKRRLTMYAHAFRKMQCCAGAKYRSLRPWLQSRRNPPGAAVLRAGRWCMLVVVDMHVHGRPGTVPWRLLHLFLAHFRAGMPVARAALLQEVVRVGALQKPPSELARVPPSQLRRIFLPHVLGVVPEGVVHGNLQPEAPPLLVRAWPNCLPVHLGLARFLLAGLAARAPPALAVHGEHDVLSPIDLRALE